MLRGFGGTAIEPAQGRDRELTLGPIMLALLVLGLCGLCAVCFIAGFAAGRRSTPAAAQSAAGSSAAQLLSGQSKPSASENGLQPRPDAQTASTYATSPGTSTTAAPAPAPAAYSTSPASPAPPVVQTALPAQPSATQSVSAAGQTVQPALAQNGSWMVQIAAVSHPEDADVLVGALRKRGYAVSVHRDPTDNLMHVQVGPFFTHTDAASMRQRLLNDGYNAIIEP